jgi:hypothetical protein
LSRWCNETAIIFFVCVYISIFYNLDDDFYYSSFHPLFFGAYLWHDGLCLLNDDSIPVCRDVIDRDLLCWWCSYSYWWVVTRDGPMILISVCALIGLKYSQSLDDSLWYYTISIDDYNSKSDFIPTPISIRRWRQRRFVKFRCIPHQVIIRRSIYCLLRCHNCHHQYSRHRHVRRF